MICEGFRLPFPISHKRKKEERSAKRYGRPPATFFFLSLTPLSRTHILSLPLSIRIALTCQYCNTGTLPNTKHSVVWCCVLRVFQSIASHRLLCGSQGRLIFYYFFLLCYYCSSFSFDFCFSDKIVRNNISY